MARISFNRKRAKLKQLLGIRARLALLAVILVAPLMLERARSLEDTRSKQVAQALVEFQRLANHSADTQREVISSVETVLKSAAYIPASAGISRVCDILRASLPNDLPWIRNVLLVGGEGRVQCSTNNTFVGVDLSDKPYIKRARATETLVFSDFVYVASIKKAVMLAIYPVSAINGDSDAMVVASISLDWMSGLMDNLAGKPGISAALVDSDGIVLAAPKDQASIVGKPLDSIPVMAAIAQSALDSNQDRGTLSFGAVEGPHSLVSFERIAGTGARLIASIDEHRVTADINRDIRNAYLQLGFVVLFVLIGALVAAEKLIIQPIAMMASMAKLFGQGDSSARVKHTRLPSEFVPLARAFNAMAAQLGHRQRELVASNDRLTVMASIDMLSGLANRRGFQSRLDFEWKKAKQYDGDLSLLMIDVDHFKLYNDTYGHPEGDTCLTQLGQTLSRIAAETMGFAARYGGEEFCLLLPNTDVARARIIGEAVRSAVEDLALPHRASSYQHITVSVGVASARPNDSQHPGDLVEAADAALYAAKHRGRNNVVEHGFAAAADGAAGGVAMAS
jgi:diguanylate cyclase (GGDEF)-like protein